MQEVDSPKHWWLAQVGQFFSTGDIQYGKGLTADKARDATFLFKGAGTWVGKSAYLTTNPMIIQEGKRAIAQAVLVAKNVIGGGETRGLNHLSSLHLP